MRENVKSHKCHKSTARINKREREIICDWHFQKGEYSKYEKCRGKGLIKGRYKIESQNVNKK